MSLSDLMQQMADAGAPLDAILIAVRAIEARDAETAARRAKDAARKKAKRDEAASTDIPRTFHGHGADNADLVSLDKESPQTPKKLNPSACVNGSLHAREAWVRLPIGWTPTRPLPPKTQAKVDQWPPGALDAELAAMHRWGLNASNERGKGRKKDWDAAWVNWIERRHDERYGKPANALGRNQPGDGLSATTRAAVAVFGPPEASAGRH